MKTIKRAIALVIYNKDKTRVLAIQRPKDDDFLPSGWDLPAGLARGKETFEDAAVRAGKEKLGVKAKVQELIGEDRVEIEKNITHMKVFEAKITRGKPKVPQKVETVTQYQAWEWTTPNELIESAREGGLASRIFLTSIGVDWKKRLNL